MRLFSIVSIIILSSVAYTADLQPRVDEYLESYVQTNNFQGIVLIAHRDEILIEKGYGMANLELAVPNKPETVFHIASVSKPFTAAAIMRLVEKGTIGLDTTLSDIIPEYPNANRLTLHHLLSHTSGIPNINDLEEYENIQLHAQTPESLLEYFKDLPLEFEPGRQYSYSNSNYNLLALVIERTSEQSFAKFLDDWVLAPAETKSTAHDSDSSAIIYHRADGYSPSDLFGIRRAPWLDWSAKTGNGSMVSTANDLFLWTRAFFNDKIVSSKSRELILTEHTSNVGYGWFVRPRHGRIQYHINGRSPGFSSYVGYYPNENITIIVLTNLYNSITTSVGTDLAAILFDAPYKVPHLSVEPLADDVAGGIDGRYQYGSDFYNANVIVTLEIRSGHVHQLWGDGEFESALIPQGNDQFIDRAFWSEVEFVRDEHGKVIEVHFDGFVAPRID